MCVQFVVKGTKLRCIIIQTDTERRYMYNVCMYQTNGTIIIFLYACSTTPQPDTGTASVDDITIKTAPMIVRPLGVHSVV